MENIHLYSRLPFSLLLLLLLLLQEAVSRRILVGRISSVSTDTSAFLSISVVFSELLTSTSDEKSDQPKEEEMDQILRDRDKVYSVVNLMIDKCFAKRLKNAQ